MLDSTALTKVQSVALIAIVVVAAVSGSAGYVLWRANRPLPEDIRIGVCADLDMPGGKGVLRGAVLAAEQVNAEGGVLGRNFTIVAEDDDSQTPPVDISVSNNAFAKLITVDDAEYVIDSGAGTFIPHMDLAAEHQKILFATSNVLDELAQRVLDDYNKYKYFFRVKPNATSATGDTLYSILTLGNYTGFTKIAILAQDNSAYRAMASVLNSSLPKNGFEIVYNELVPQATTDFTSYFARIESSGAQILLPMFATQAAISFVKEYTDRQSPFVAWGSIIPANDNNFWNLTEGKCEYASFIGEAIVAGYPLTSKTIPAREAYIEKWGEIPTGFAVSAYDIVRFILPDAIKRAGTTETEAVIKALETVNIETARARRFAFTSSHDVMVRVADPNGLGEDYMWYYMFQWQDGTQAPVYPRHTMEEAGATYKYPPWQGPWSK